MTLLPTVSQPLQVLVEQVAGGVKHSNMKHKK